MSAIPRASAASGDRRRRRVDHLTTCVARSHPRPAAPAEPAAGNPKCICNSGASALVKRPRFNGKSFRNRHRALAKTYSLRLRLRKDCFSLDGARLTLLCVRAKASRQHTTSIDEAAKQMPSLGIATLVSLEHDVPVP